MLLQDTEELCNEPWTNSLLPPLYNEDQVNAAYPGCRAQISKSYRLQGLILKPDMLLRGQHGGIVQIFRLTRPHCVLDLWKAWSCAMSYSLVQTIPIYRRIECAGCGCTSSKHRAVLVAERSRHDHLLALINGLKKLTKKSMLQKDGIPSRLPLLIARRNVIHHLIQDGHRSLNSKPIRSMKITISHSQQFQNGHPSMFVYIQSLPWCLPCYIIWVQLYISISKNQSLSKIKQIMYMPL